MSQRRGTKTTQLANIIQVIQLGRKTGQLVVERGEGTLLEEGTITFAYGQIMQVRAGPRTGQEALVWLNAWGPCWFLFVPSNMERITRPLEAVPNVVTSPRVPHRVQQIEESLRLLNQARLSRVHRHLLLLIDGQRTMTELGLLTGRRQDEVQRLLHDLEQIGIIQQ